MYVIGISGGVASGKTTLANKISSIFDNVAVLSLDSYFYPFTNLSLEQRKNIDFDNPQVYDYDLIIKHIKMLAANQEIHVPNYSFSEYTRTDETILIKPPKVLLVEGYAVLYNEQLRNLMDFSLFIDIDETTQLKRLLRRDKEERQRSENEILFHFNNTIRKSNKNFIYPQKKYANLVITDAEK